jgi:sodium/potassium-transporting ATPase subunit alpha
MASILKRLRRSDSVKPTDDKSHDDAEAPSPISSAAERDLSRSFTEQHLNFEQLAKLHPKSRINVKNPKKTIGLSARDAADRLVTDGRNWLPPPKELSNWRLLLKQFLNFFWLLLVGAGILSLITYALDTTVPMNLYAGIVLFSIVIVMCTIQFLEEKKARNVSRYNYIVTKYVRTIC